MIIDLWWNLNTDHPRDQENVVLIHRCFLYAGSITWKVYLWWAVECGLYKQVVFIYRPAIYMQVVFTAGLTVYQTLGTVRCVNIYLQNLSILSHWRDRKIFELHDRTFLECPMTSPNFLTNSRSRDHLWRNIQPIETGEYLMPVWPLTPLLSIAAVTDLYLHKIWLHIRYA